METLLEEPGVIERKEVVENLDTIVESSDTDSFEEKKDPLEELTDMFPYKKDDVLYVDLNDIDGVGEYRRIEADTEVFFIPCTSSEIEEVNMSISSDRDFDYNDGREKIKIDGFEIDEDDIFTVNASIVHDDTSLPKEVFVAEDYILDLGNPIDFKPPGMETTLVQVNNVKSVEDSDPVLSTETGNALDDIVIPELNIGDVIYVDMNGAGNFYEFFDKGVINVPSRYDGKNIAMTVSSDRRFYSDGKEKIKITGMDDGIQASLVFDDTDPSTQVYSVQDGVLNLENSLNANIPSQEDFDSIQDNTPKISEIGYSDTQLYLSHVKRKLDHMKMPGKIKKNGKKKKKVVDHPITKKIKNIRRVWQDNLLINSAFIIYEKIMKDDLESAYEQIELMERISNNCIKEITHLGAVIDIMEMGPKLAEKNPQYEACIKELQGISTREEFDSFYQRNERLINDFANANEIIKNLDDAVKDILGWKLPATKGLDWTGLFKPYTDEILSRLRLRHIDDYVFGEGDRSGEVDHIEVDDSEHRKFQIIIREIVDIKPKDIQQGIRYVMSYDDAIIFYSKEGVMGYTFMKERKDGDDNNVYLQIHSELKRSTLTVPQRLEKIEQAYKGKFDHLIAGHANPKSMDPEVREVHRYYSKNDYFDATRVYPHAIKKMHILKKLR